MTLILCLPAAAIPPAGLTQDYIDDNMKSFDNDTYIDANKILMFVTNHGDFARDLTGVFGYVCGTFYPYNGIENIYNGTLTSTVLYAGGLWLGGKVNGEIRVAVAEYEDEYVPGPMAGGTYQPDRPSFKVYKLYADSLGSNPNSDYSNWPVGDGAPLNDDGDPLQIGGQTLWAVFNDANPYQHGNDAGKTDPLGVEVQQLIWAVNDDGGLEIPLSAHLYVDHYDYSPMIVQVDIANPLALNGNDYMVVIDSVAGYGPVWNLINTTTSQTLLSNQTNFSGDDNYPVIDGFRARVIWPTRVMSWSWIGNTMPITGVDWGLSTFYGGVGTGDEFFGSSLTFDSGFTVEIRWVPDGTGQMAYCYRRDLGYAYDGYFPQNFTVWDVTGLPERQINFAFVEYYNPSDPSGQNADSIWNPGEQVDQYGYPDPFGGREYFFVLNSDYSPTAQFPYNQDDPVFNANNDFDCLIGGIVQYRIDDGKPDPGDIWQISYIAENPGVPDTFTFQGTPPLGSLTSGPDGVSIYMRYKLYNRSADTIKDFYIAQWSDPDIGQYTDDYVGCDTLNDIWYCYNGDNSDNDFGTAIPAAGFKAISGPVVPSPGDTADFDGHGLPGYKNIGMTSFSKYINGTDPDNSVETYYFMQGLYKDGSPWPNGTKYAVPGDPVTGTGDLDYNPGDRRMMASFGPLTFNPGDSQYIFLKFSVGHGTNRLNSVTLMKNILNSDPYVEPTDVTYSTLSPVPTDYSLMQNYPNPFNPVTSIKFTTPRRGRVTLEIFNVLGQKVRSLLDDDLSAGRHRVTFDGRDENGRVLASGIYLYRIQAGDFTQSRRMALIK